MSPSPATINDYLDLIRLRIEEHTSAFARDVGRIDGECSLNGASGGSRHFLRLAAALKKEFLSAAGDVLRALPAAHQIGGLDRNELLDLTGPRLAEMLAVMMAVTRLEKRVDSISNPEFKASILSYFDECRARIPVLLRQSQIGFDRIWDEEGRRVTNTINAGQIIGGVQQGTASSTQHISIAIDRVIVESAIQALEKQLGDSANDAEIVATVRADVETIKAQLAKREPSRTILSEVGKTLRNVVEGVTGGLLTPAASSAILGLSAVL